MLNWENEPHFLAGILEMVCTNLFSVRVQSADELLAKHLVLVQTSPLSPKQRRISLSLALEHLPVPNSTCCGLELGFTLGKANSIW